MSKIITFDGIDTSGKTTISTALSKKTGFSYLKSPFSKTKEERAYFDQKETSIQDRYDFYMKSNLDDQGHRIQAYQPTTTVFLADKTYKTRGFPKSNGAYIKRGHVKKLKNQQAAFESRGYDLYGISAQELYSIILDEIDSILIKN